jgi:putative transposase
MMCRLLNVSTSGYYEWRSRKPGERQQDNTRLLKKIRDIHQDSDGVFGSPRIYEELRYRGETCSLNRVARLMQSNVMAGIPCKRQWRKRKPGMRPDDIRNHLNRDFAATEANMKWVTDITYVRTGEGWLYLAVIIDLYDGLVIGWSMSSRMRKQLVIQAVLMALWRKQDKVSVILHSDRGSQYTSHEYQQFLKDHKIVSSMSAVGSCYDNAAAESFFGVLKRERVNRRYYVTRAEARADIFDYIETFYNWRKRRKLGKTDQTTLN